MKLSFRWYGKSDPIPLEYIRQIPGMRSIVTAVYDVKPGEVWPEESLAGLKKDCEDNGLLFDVVESIPVHEDISWAGEMWNGCWRSTARISAAAPSTA